MIVRVDDRGWALIDHTFRPDQLGEIWRAIDHLHDHERFLAPTHSGSALDPQTGRAIKQNQAVFLDDHPEIDLSPTITTPWLEPRLTQALRGSNPLFGLLEIINYTTSLISYYEEGDHYGSHRDTAVFTLLTWLWREPRAWQGGEFQFTELGVTIPVEQDMSILFPSHYPHQALSTHMTTQEPRSGRYCLAQLGYVRP